jgi:hypothetical protein
MFKRSLIAVLVMISSITYADPMFQQLPKDKAEIIVNAAKEVGNTQWGEFTDIMGLHVVDGVGYVQNNPQIITINNGGELRLARWDDDGKVIVFGKEVSDFFFNAGDTSTPAALSLEDNKSATGTASATTGVANNETVEAPKKEASTGTSGIKNPYANFQPLPFSNKIRINEMFEYKDIQYMLVSYDRDRNTKIFHVRDPYTGREKDMMCFGSVGPGKDIAINVTPNEVCHHFNPNRRDLRSDFPVKDIPEPKNITKDTTWIPYYLDFDKTYDQKSYAIFHGRKVYFRNPSLVGGYNLNSLVLSYMEHPKLDSDEISCGAYYGVNYADDKIHPEDPITAEFCHQLHDAATN